MYYVIGHSFKVTATPTQPVRQGGSVQQQLAEARRNAYVPKTTQTEALRAGTSYQLYHIRIVKENNITKYKYTFREYNTGAFVDVFFDSTAEADTVIARLSGQLQQLETQRTKAAEERERES